jgi:SAM-dependent methyltransferase
MRCNEAGVGNGNSLARARNLSDRVRFEYCDASRALPFSDAPFDAALANDVLCHVPGRDAVLKELHRVLKPQGRLVFSDALVIGGTISHQEIATRSSIGFYLFTPPGHNERLIRDVGFQLIEARDTTQNAAAIAGRWRDARTERRDPLIALEGESTFDGVQQFLLCVYTLCSERRLLRYLYVAQKLGRG